MIIPIRCFTCGKVIADKYDYYLQAVAKMEHDTVHTVHTVHAKHTEKDKAAHEANEAKAAQEAKEEAYKTRHFDTIRTGAILDNMGLTRYCCRRHMLATVDMMEII